MARAFPFLAAVLGFLAGGAAPAETLRVATRSIAYHPALFTSRDRFWLDYLKRKQLELRQRGTHIEVATHFIHPDEISVHSLDLITELVASGVPVYVQTPFLGGCNDSGETLASLFGQLRAAGAEIHYVFLPCSPIQGNARYSSPISRALEKRSSGRFARARSSALRRAGPAIASTASPPSGGSCSRRTATSVKSRPPKGRRPVSISCSTAAAEKRSLRASGIFTAWPTR